MPPAEKTTTIAILGTNTVIEKALALLLEGFGYHTRLLDAYPTGGVAEMLSGADLVLLAPNLGNEGRTALLSAVRGGFTTAHTPVLALCATPGEALDDEKGTLLVPWPSPISMLTQQIEAILASTSNDKVGTALSS